MVEQTDASELRSIAGDLVGCSVVSIERVGGGRNSAVYRVTDATGRAFALKQYPIDGRGRQDAELKALSYMARVNIDSVPEVLSLSSTHGVTLLSWLEGSPIGTLTNNDVEQFAEFQRLLSTRVDATARADIGEASEACLSGSRIVAQIERRMPELAAMSDRDPLLFGFFHDVYLPWFQRSVERIRQAGMEIGVSFDGLLSKDLQTLIPSDFGSHNAVRLPSGDIAFLDFEYFGWDDPVTSISNFIQHPAMQLNSAQRELYQDRVLSFYEDPSIYERHRLYAPLFAIRWIAIILSELTPSKWRDRHGVRGEAWEATCSRQLALAHALFARYQKQ